MLAGTQERLEQHFAALKSERSTRDFPVYAFEHGLQITEVEAIRQGLQQRLREHGQPLHENWLLWIIAAVEIGYTYDGEEFWQSFKKEFPQWQLHADRRRMRRWFKIFATRFGGFSPRGRWADHFSIIAWPITHSILPRYLQAHFAAHLHGIRYDLARQGYVGITQLGDLVRRRYYGGSSRFEDFLQQTDLTARLILALRDEDIHDDISPIHRPTLARIVSDLEARSSVRNHLREARTVLREARFKSTNLASAARTTHLVEGSTNAQVIRAASPKIVGRRAPSGEWQLGVAFPDFAGMLRSSMANPAELDQTRMRFKDESRWMPGRALLSYSNKHRPFVEFPMPDSDFIEFDSATESLLEVVGSHLKLQGGFPFLLRVSDDGIARQVHGNHVRAAQSYVLVLDQPPPADTANALSLDEAACKTTGVALYQMEAPALFSEGHLRALRALHLGYGLRARIRPVGLVPRLNGDGGSTWLTDEEVVLGISADFDVSAYFLSIDDGQRIRIPAAKSSEILVSLGALPIGSHLIQVTAESNVAPRIEAEAFSVEVRAHKPWRQSVSEQAGFRLLMDPPNATFEDMAEGRAKISISGPESRIARIELRLFGVDGHVCGVHELARIAIPASTDVCRGAIEKIRREPVAEKLQSAPRFDIAVIVEDLGYDNLTFQHVVDPMRWRLEHAGKTLLARLADEAGADHRVTIWRYDIGRPERRAVVDKQSCLAGFSVSPPGSLFVARHRGRRYSAVISLREKLTNFSDLGAHVDIAYRGNVTPARHVAWLLAQHKRWRLARPLGPLAVVHKAKVVATIAQRVAQILCRGKWADELELARNGQVQLADRLQREVGGSPGFALGVWDSAFLSKDAKDLLGSFIEKARVYRITADAKLCALAFRMAFYLSDVQFEGWSHGQRQLRSLVGNCPLARGAYLAKLAFDLGSQPSIKGSAS